MPRKVPIEIENTKTNMSKESILGLSYTYCTDLQVRQNNVYTIVCIVNLFCLIYVIQSGFTCIYKKKYMHINRDDNDNNQHINNCYSIIVNVIFRYRHEL